MKPIFPKGSDPLLHRKGLVVMRQPMTWAYRAVFTFVIVMTVLVFIIGAVTRSSSVLGIFIWGYTAWLMHKRRNETLVRFYRGLLIVDLVIGVIGLFLLANFGDTISGRHVVVGTLVALSMLACYLLMVFFKRQTGQVIKSTALTETIAEIVVTQDSGHLIITPPSNSLTQTVSSVSNIENEHYGEGVSNESNSTDRTDGLRAKSLLISDDGKNKAKVDCYTTSGLSPLHLIFWRNVVGIAFLLLAQNPAQYSSYEILVRLWLQTMTISFASATFFSGVCYLFFTYRMKSKLWLFFLVCAWIFALLQLLGHWFMPSVMYKVVSFPSAFLTSPQQNSHPQNTFRQSTNLAPEARINSEDLGADKSSAEQSGVPVVGLTLTQLRILYPAYDDLSDDELSDGIYKKFYAGQDRAKIKRLYGFWPSK